mmetsp:Transcript_60331/g.132135  ORF Transcript_60331/g.132135 Transcript_60331/m.132135 type:complete len:94 (+) Transcript_60331:1049-1330(+)
MRADAALESAVVYRLSGESTRRPIFDALRPSKAHQPIFRRFRESIDIGRGMAKKVHLEQAPKFSGLEHFAKGRFVDLTAIFPRLLWKREHHSL